MSTDTQSRDLVEARIAAHAKAILAAAPPLTAEQRAEIAAIMSGGAR